MRDADPGIWIGPTISQRSGRTQATQFWGSSVQ
jgi:hypothetical protein